MPISPKEWVAMSLIAAVAIMSGIGISGTVAERNEEHRVQLKYSYDLGHTSGDAGLEASANPYQGTRGHSRESELWLEGWLDSKTWPDKTED